MPLYDQFGKPLAPTPNRVVRQPKPSAAYYSAVYHSRMRSRRPFHVADASSSMGRGVREILVSMARDLMINVGEVRAIIQGLTRYSIGDGLVVSSACVDEGCANEYTDYFADWSENVDVFSGASFRVVQKIVSQSFLVDGDIGVAFVEDMNGDPKLQLFESHRIETPNRLEGKSGKSDGRVVIDGVEFDRAANRVAYWVREVRPRDVFEAEDVKHRRIPVENFMLVFDPERAGQARGVSAIAHGITDGQDLAEVLASIKMGVKIREGVAMVVYNESGVASPEDDPSLTFRSEDLPVGLGQRNPVGGDNDTPINFDLIAPGAIPRLKENERIADLQTNRPGEAAHMFLDMLVGRISAGVGLPFELLFTPRRSVTGPQVRALNVKSQICFDSHARLIETQLCKPVWRLVIGDAIQKGILMQSEGWDKVKFRRPPKFSIDAGRDSLASLSELKAGTTTMEADAASRGEDWQSIQDQRAREADRLLEQAKGLADKHGVELDVALGMLTDVTDAIKSLQSRVGESGRTALNTEGK